MSRFDRIHGSNKKENLMEEEIFGNKKENNKKKLKKFIRIFIFIILILIGTIVYIALSTGLLQDPTGLIKFQNQFNDGKVNILFLGSDKRPNEENQARSDSIIVGSFDFKKGVANLLSIPRDTRVKISGFGEDKINHAYAFGGIETSIKTIENFIDVKIDRFIEIDFESFKSIVDKLGGIEINIEDDMYYIEEGIDLKAGKQLLNGYNSLAYVRFRGTPNGDFGRIQRQQKFILALFNAIKENSNIFKQMNTLASFLKNIKTNISIQEAIYMFSKYKDFKEFKISTWTSSGTPEMIQEISYMIPSIGAEKDDAKFLNGELITINDSNDYDKKKLIKP